MKFIYIENTVFPIDRPDDLEAAQVTLGLLGLPAQRVRYVKGSPGKGKRTKKLNYYVKPDKSAKRVKDL